MKNKLNHYRAVVRSVDDGNTLVADIDMGFGIWKYEVPLRLYRINAPEIQGPDREAGLRSRDFLRRLIAGRKTVIKIIKAKNEEQGGLAEIWLGGDDGKWANVNDSMVEQGYAFYL